ncbi:MAG: delta-60 repeat domain-containing protein, partial [Proteobacteria bacterium]|nr:delta-60 repeat domain-containing protein [Pseudomonadota bacterium]
MNTDNLQRVRLVKSLPTTCHLVGLRQACRRVAVGLVVFSLALFLLGPAWAADGDLDPSFNPGVGVKSVPMLWGRINYADSIGKMMITGSFTEMGGYPRSGIARLKADGSLDDTFNAAITGYVNGCILLNNGSPDSQMLICGDFSIPSKDPLKPPYYGLARLNADGSVDDTFAHTFTTGDGVQAMGKQVDGNIVVGGYAMKVSGYPDNAYFLVRLNNNGAVDTNYMLSAPGGNVNGLWVDQGVAGQVRLFGTIPRFSDPTHVDHMLLLSADGKTKVSGIGDEIVNGTILGMTWQGSNTVIFGSFTQVHGQSRNGIARLLPTGGLDPTFIIGSGANGHVKRAVNDDDKLVLNGYFNSFNGTPCGYMVRLNNDGTVDGEFNKGGSGADDRIWNVFKQSDLSWVVLGAFQSFNGSPRQCLASLDINGNLTSNYPLFTTSFPISAPKVYAVQDSPQGIYIAGTFSRYGGKLHRRVARVNYDGTPDASFRAGIGGVVNGISIQQDGKLLVAGHFGVGTGYVGCTSLARLNLDGTMDLTFKPVLTKADGSLPDIFMVDSLDNGQIMIGGDFAKIADANHVMQPRTAFARLNPDGSLDTT